MAPFEYKVCSVGNRGVGKTRVVLRFITGQFYSDEEMDRAPEEDTYRERIQITVDDDDDDNHEDNGGSKSDNSLYHVNELQQQPKQKREESVRLYIWDGYPQYDGEQLPLIQQYWTRADGFLLFFSLVDRHSFTDTVKYLYMIERTMDEPNIENIPIVLVGCKYDMETERVITTRKPWTLHATTSYGMWRCQQRPGTTLTSVSTCWRERW